MKQSLRKRWLAAMLAGLLAAAPLGAAFAEEPPVEVSAPEPEAEPAPEAPAAPAPEPETKPEAPEEEAQPEPEPEAPAPEEGAEAPAPEESTETPQEPAAEATPEAEESAAPAESPVPEPEKKEDQGSGKRMLDRSLSAHNNRLNPAELRIPADGMPIPQIFQFNYTRGVCEFDGDTKTVAISGCGATVASMVVAYICGDYEQTPYTLFYEAARKGWYSGEGMNYHGIRKLLASCGVSAEQRDVSAKAITTALKAGQPIIINMGPGIFADEGHFILLRGLNANGRVLVNDPDSEGNSSSNYSLNRIVEECKNGRMLVVTTAAQPGTAPMPIATDTPK